MTSEHEVLVDVAAMGDILQRLLDAEAAGIGEAAGRIALIVGPGRETALAEAAHAIGLVLADQRLFVGRHEHQRVVRRSEEHTSELQSLMRISYAVFCLKKKKKYKTYKNTQLHIHIILQDS